MNDPHIEARKVQASREWGRLFWILLVTLMGVVAPPGRATVGKSDVAPLRSGGQPRPLMRDFVGYNAHAAGHDSDIAFDPHLYRPVGRMVREYHRMSRDLGDEPAVPAPLPRGKDGTDWEAIYRGWVAQGWDIDACLQFELVERGKWRDIETEARDYARAFARTFGPSGQRRLVNAVEIGNEPSQWSDRDFVRIFSAMARGLREGDPQLRIVTSNLTVGPSGKWDKSVELVAPYREFFDVLAVHIYAEVAQHPTWQRSYPENPKLLRYLNDVEALCRWRDAHAPEKEVWITEFGYDSSTKTADPKGKYPEWIGVTDEQQAQWLVRSLLVFAAMPVERAYIFFFNDQDVPSLHASAGITRNFQPKPSYYALAHLQRLLGDYRFQRVVSDEPGALRVQEFVQEKEPEDVVWVAWSPTGSKITALRSLQNVPGNLLSAETMALDAAGMKSNPAIAAQRADGSVDVHVMESLTYLRFRKPSGR